MFKGVAFDLDGVITDTAEFHYLAWKKLGEELDIPFDRDFNEQLKGISRTESLDLILALGGQENHYTSEKKQELMAWKNDLYINLIQNITKNDILPGILNLLEAFKKNHIKMAVASASKNAPMILSKLQIIDFFDVIVDPSTLDKGKPAPDIFISSAKQLNLRTDDMIGIEDSQAGITSINDAHMFSIGIGKLKDADYLVPSTNELDFKKIKHVYNTKEV